MCATPLAPPPSTTRPARATQACFRSCYTQGQQVRRFHSPTNCKPSTCAHYDGGASCTAIFLEGWPLLLDAGGTDSLRQDWWAIPEALGHFACHSGVATFLLPALPLPCLHDCCPTLPRPPPAPPSWLFPAPAVDAPTTNGCTPLYIAANNGFAEAAALLLETGANPDGETHSGCTALHAGERPGAISK